MVVLAFEELLLQLVHLISCENIEIVSAASEIRLVFGQVLVVDSECPVMAYVCKSVCGALRAEPAVESVVS